jgi:hypothetical protein
MDFERFLEDMEAGWKPGLTLHRIDDTKGYGPGNVEWANWKKQNCESLHARHITFNGITRTISDWSRSLGGHHMLVFNRLRYGWPLKDALTIPRGSVRRFKDYLR